MYPPHPQQIKIHDFPLPTIWFPTSHSSLGFMGVYIWITYDLLALLFNYINSVFRTYPNECSVEHWYSKPLTRISYTTVTRLLIQWVTKTMMHYKAGKSLENFCLCTFCFGLRSNSIIIFTTKCIWILKNQHFNSFNFHVRLWNMCTVDIQG